METVTTIAELQARLNSVRRSGQRIGFVPTMGALHEGHLSLIRAARNESDLIVVSIFVNPTQFGPHEDFARYPRPLARDLEQCQDVGANLVFAPEPSTLYPEEFSTFVEVVGLSNLLEGAIRPGHFRGVCTVVLKLLNLVTAHVAFFGQKDAQQVIVLRRMMRDLAVPVEMRVCPTVREADGLALSSRNVYLTADQRREAVALSQALREALEVVRAGERDGGRLQALLGSRIAALSEGQLDYAVVVDPETLQPVANLCGKVLLALAVRFGATRLIDNLVLRAEQDAVAEVTL